MFSLIYASLLAYMTKKGGKPSNLGALVSQYFTLWILVLLLSLPN